MPTVYVHNHYLIIDLMSHKLYDRYLMDQCNEDVLMDDQKIWTKLNVQFRHIVAAEWVT